MFKINVLDHGNIELLNIANAIPRNGTPFDAQDQDPAIVARQCFASFDKERTVEQDLKLVKHLEANKHTSCLEMTEFWFSMKLPLFVADQFKRHRSASLLEHEEAQSYLSGEISMFDHPTINQTSARYVALPGEWYIPEIVGGKAANAKQGQEDNLDIETQKEFKDQLNTLCIESYSSYKIALSVGIAPEHARLFLHTNHYCVHVDTPILTQDLKWVKAGDLNKGSRLLGFDEYNNGKKQKRRLKPSIITNFSIEEDELYKITLSNGDTLISNINHKWLTRYISGSGTDWRTVAELKKNPKLWAIPKLLDVWKEEKSYNAGFLAASFDGEGYITYTTNNGKALGFSQKENSMLQKVRELLLEEGFWWTENINHQSGTKNLRLSGGLYKILEFLGKYRPPRLLDKWMNDCDGGIWCKDLVPIEKIEYIGNGKIASFSTSTKTYIANGYPSHNTQWVWKQDLHNLLHFMALRVDSHAQVEARVYGEAMYQLIKRVLPETMKLFDEYRRLDLLRMSITKEELQFIENVRMRNEARG